MFLFKVVQTFIDQYRFLFCGLEEVMMVQQAERESENNTRIERESENKTGIERESENGTGKERESENGRAKERESGKQRGGQRGRRAVRGRGRGRGRQGANFSTSNPPPIILWKLKSLCERNFFGGKFSVFGRYREPQCKKYQSCHTRAIVVFFFANQNEKTTKRGRKYCILAVITETPLYVGNAKEISDTNDKSNVPCLK